MPELSKCGNKQYQSPPHSAARGSSPGPDVQSPPLSKPTAIDFSMMMPQLLKDIDSRTAPQIISKIKEAMRQAEKAEEYDQWFSPEGEE